MPSPFVDHLLKPLELSRPSTSTAFARNVDLNESKWSEIEPKEKLQSLLASLNQPLSPSLVQDTVGSLIQLERRPEVSAAEADPENKALKEAIITKLLVGLYAEGIEGCLSQATQAETEAEWWADIERSWLNVAWYLLQTLPPRLAKLIRVILGALRAQGVPISLSAFSPSSLRQLFPSTDHRRPSALSTTVFPHLRRQPFSITSSTILYSTFSPHPTSHGSVFTKVWATLNPVLTLAIMPIELTRQECNFKRKELEKIRDQRAEALGYLSQMRGELAVAVKEPWNIQRFVHVLTYVIEGDMEKAFNPSDVESSTTQEPLQQILRLSTTVHSTQRAAHLRLLESRELLRPSGLTLIWPQLVLLPPLCVYALRSAYASRAAFFELAMDAKATVEGFVRGWLLDPLKDVIKTVRAGGEEGVIVQPEGIAADFASLERMTLALAKDQLKYTPEQLEALSRQIRQGDLTPVLRIYEEDIKSPVKSALTGTLLRSVFIQVQKAKVDIDQALAGIDKLLKSQELTFAFVGVAPALAIVYLLGGSLVTLWRGGRGRGKYGGKRVISGVWSAMRRTERLLVSQPGSRQRKEDEEKGGSGSIPPLTSGLLLLSVARLRSYAETHLPPRSRLREGFLEDVGDLENPDLGRGDKMRVVERMWRCWGETLGWGSIPAQGISRK
ncbi:putative NCA2-domain-containing protein [Lyophyllum shimeji]|uniref:NCA2-domain-containing protein n=1 Tax=Lyophyllum shimeji TaxID=47721 RepID=A0A9P3PN49_LYOSH|nr:putative NCA2-domain-containing protein [Lyophyllum shimeji]